MKALKPSMREHKRYLKIVGENLKETIEKAILEFVGVLGFSKASPKFIRVGKNSAIISINREALNEVRASFAVFNKEIIVKKVSGTLKGLGK